MEKRNDKLAGLKKRFVSNARAIISEEVGLSIGVRKMCNIILWLNEEEPSIYSSRTVFQEYDNRIREIPYGTARLYCSKEAFKRYDDALNRVNEAFRERIFNACFEIIEKFGDKNNRLEL